MTQFRNAVRLTARTFFRGSRIDLGCRYFENEDVAMRWWTANEARFVSEDASAHAETHSIQISDLAWEYTQAIPDNEWISNPRTPNAVYLQDVANRIPISLYRLCEDPAIYETALDAYFKERTYVDR